MSSMSLVQHARKMPPLSHRLINGINNVYFTTIELNKKINQTCKNLIPLVKMMPEIIDDTNLPLLIGLVDWKTSKVKEELQTKAKTWYEELPEEVKTPEFWIEKAKPSPKMIAGGMALASIAQISTTNATVNKTFTTALRTVPEPIARVYSGQIPTVTSAMREVSAIVESEVTVAETFTEVLPDTIKIPIVNNAVEPVSQIFDAYATNFHEINLHLTPEIIDGFLRSTGIPYDENRVNGEMLIHWQSISGVNAAVLLTQAIWESALGTRGVAATVEGCNMFGYGAYDSSPEKCAAYSDVDAVMDFAAKLANRPYWNSFQKMDEAAMIYAHGNGVKPTGGVYFSDMSGVGHRRAQTLHQIATFAGAEVSISPVLEISTVQANLAVTSVAAQVLQSQVETFEREYAEITFANVEEVKQEANGFIGVDKLCSLSWAEHHRLRCDAAASLEHLNEAFKAEFGHDLELTDSYRNYDRQVDLRQRKPHLAAAPGTSQHGLAVAIDCASNVNIFGSAQHQWMILNSWKFGWVKPHWATSKGVKHEPWHFEFWGDSGADTPAYAQGQEFPRYGL